METALEVRALDAYYGKAHIVQEIDMIVHAGELSAIVGRNGVGKTTFLRGILGLVKTEARAIRLGKLEIGNMPTYRRSRAGIAFMPQDLRYIAGLNVNEMFQLAISSAQNPGSVGAVLELIPEIKPLLRRKAETLSGGQKQLVAFARSLLVNPKVLILDEPTEGLMPTLVMRVGELLRSAIDAKIAVILVEQNLNLIYSIATNINVMHKGRFVASGPVATLRKDGVIERYLGLNEL